LKVRGYLFGIIPGSGVRLIMSRVAHGAELGDKEVIAAMIGWRVLLNVGKFHKLQKRTKEEENIY